LEKNADRSVQERVLKGMVSTLLHRGPDAWGLYLSPYAALGHTRLSILDLSGGHQPMASGQYVLSYNGEVYNYIELREELIKKGAVFLTSSDTEVVLKCFEYYGISVAIRKFNGQFALLLWDKINEKLYAARDRFGIRPLYVLAFEERLYFASEMKAFDTIPGFQREVDPYHFFQHGLLWNSLDDASIYKNIRTVSPGTYEEYTVGRNDCRRYRYYEIGDVHENTEVSWDQAKASFRDMLEDAVRLRLRSDVPVAAYLSGGIDSSVVSYLVESVTQKRFGTFSVSFSDSEFDESEYQIEMARKLCSEHVEEKVAYKDVNDNFLNAIYHIERPVFRTAPIPLYLLSKRVKDNGIKVVITGEGADEILFGYDSFKELKLLEFWSKQPQSRLRPQLLKRLYPHLLHYSDSKQFGLLKMYYEGFIDSYSNNLSGLNIRAYNNKIISNFISKDHRILYDEEALIEDITRILPEHFSSWSLLQRNQFLEMRTLLSGYLLSSQGDRMSMAHSVEGRYPFLDHRLVDLVFSFPDHFKLKVLSQKYLLGKTFDQEIPSSILNRPKRPYMAPDLKSFLWRGDLDEKTAFFLSDDTLHHYGLFDKKMVYRFLRKFNAGIPDQIGYRDNMLITFILSAQMAMYWSRNPQMVPLNDNDKRVEIIDYQ
jgi:asparagine synthase (glutamine-hydrolysing)